MDVPKVSVIIPTFNRASMIGTAIESVLGQTWRDFELVVVDDGSIDNTEAVVAHYSAKDSRMRYLRQEHRGISATMNAGIRASHGDYIARLDSDDLWLPDLLKAEVAVLEARPEVGIVYSKAGMMDSNLNPRPSTIGYAPHFPGDALRSLLWDDCTSSPTNLVRRRCFERAGLFDESLATNEDWDMRVRIALRDEVAYVDRILARIRVHDRNTTAPDSPHFVDYLESRERVLDKFFARPDVPARTVAMKADAYRNLYIRAGCHWILAREWRRALDAFGRAMRVSGKPAATAGRIAFFLMANQVLSRSVAGRGLLRWQSALRLRLREA